MRRDASFLVLVMGFMLGIIASGMGNGDLLKACEKDLPSGGKCEIVTVAKPIQIVEEE